MLLTDLAGSSTEDVDTPAATVVEAAPALKYEPALDGLRALAVIAVILYHGDVSWMRGGYLGVDAFFVLSGFLITSLLVQEWHRDGRIGVVSFYARRARRLFPAVLLLIMGIAVYAWLFAPARQLASIRGDAVATLAYFANWRQAASPVGYFDLFQLPSPLRHTWSLAVEEQWYLLWPIAMIGLLALCRGSLKWMFVLIAGCAAASAAWGAWLHDPGADPSRVYYGTDTRAHELLVGAALAVLLAMVARARADQPVAADRPAGLGDRLLHASAIVCALLTLVCWSQAGADSGWLYEGGLLAAAVAVALVIASSVRPGSPLGPVLRFRPLVYVGLLSYGLYLWHWPVFLTLSSSRTGLDGPLLLGVRLGVTAVFAFASYRLVEGPIRGGAIRGPRLVGALAVATIVVMVAVVVTTAGAISDPARELADLPTRRVTPPPVTDEGLPGFFVVGDSVALTFTGGIERAGIGQLSLANNTILGCGLLPGTLLNDPRPEGNDARCAAWREQWEGDAAALAGNTVVLFSGVWDSYSRVVDGRELQFGTREYDNYYVRAMQRLVDRNAANGSMTVLLTEPCYEEGSARAQFGTDAAVFDPVGLDRINDLIREVGRRNPKWARVVDLYELACPEGRFLAEVDGTVVRYDGVHFTRDGGDWLAARLVPALLATQTASVPR